MSAHQKDKRTKEQILKLLDRAIEQEERLGEKIKNLEAELVACRKKAEDPRHELVEGAFPASKVSFRIDYYRNSEKSPLKGIIEHLSSRQSRSFEGEGQGEIGHFMTRFLREEAVGAKRRAAREKHAGPGLAVEQKMPDTATAHAPLETSESSRPESRLLRKLRHTVRVDYQPPEPDAVPATVSPEPPDNEMPAPRSARVERLLALSLSPETHTGARNAAQPPTEYAGQTPPDGAASPSGLLQRLRELYFDSLESR